MNQIKHKAIAIAVLAAAGVAFLAADAEAIPAFARKYQTSCSTCHVAYPKLNAFGDAFRLNGFRMPEGDEALTKEKDVPMGSEGWKKVWPKGIWPGAIPGGFPFAIVIPSQATVVEGGDVSTDFAFPSEVELFGGGTLGEGFGYYLGVTLIEGNDFGGLHRLYGQFDSIADQGLLNVKFGYYEPRAVPFSSHRRLTLSNYLMNAVGFDIAMANGFATGGDHHDEHAEDEHGETEEGAGSEHSELQTLDLGGGHGHGNGDLFTFANSQRGIELWGVTGGADGGGLVYGVGFTNGNGLGDGEETFDNNSFKDVYWRLAYKFGGMGLTGKTGAGIAEPTQTQNWVDNSFRVGTFGYYGRSPFRLSRVVAAEHEDEAEEHHDEGEEHNDEPPVAPPAETVEQVLDGDENFTRVGLDFDAGFGNLNLYGAVMYGQNDRREFDGSVDTSFTTWFVEGDYVWLPWVVSALRYEQVDLPAGFVDIERVVPSVTLLLRANIKMVIEGQFYQNQSGRNRGLFNFTFAF